MDWLKLSVARPANVEVVGLDCPAVIISEAREHLPVSLLLVPSGKGLWVAGPVLQADCQ